MPIVVATRLTAKGARGSWLLLRLTSSVVRQLARQPGFVGGRLLLEPRLAAWTVTVWADRDSLAAFRAAHAGVAAHADEVGDQLEMTAWLSDDDAVPSWSDVRARWTAVPAPRRGATLRLPGGPALVPAG